MLPDEISVMLFSKNYNFPARVSARQIMSSIPLKVSPFMKEQWDFTYTASSHQHQESKTDDGITLNSEFHALIKYCLLHFAEKLKKFTKRRGFFDAKKHIYQRPDGYWLGNGNVIRLCGSTVCNSMHCLLQGGGVTKLRAHKFTSWIKICFHCTKSQSRSMIAIWNVMRSSKE